MGGSTRVARGQREVTRKSQTTRVSNICHSLQKRVRRGRALRARARPRTSCVALERSVLDSPSEYSVERARLGSFLEIERNTCGLLDREIHPCLRVRNEPIKNQLGVSTRDARATLRREPPSVRGSGRRPLWCTRRRWRRVARAGGRRSGPSRAPRTRRERRARAPVRPSKRERDPFLFPEQRFFYYF